MYMLILFTILCCFLIFLRVLLIVLIYFFTDCISVILIKKLCIVLTTDATYVMSIPQRITKLKWSGLTASIQSRLTNVRSGADHSGV